MEASNTSITHQLEGFMGSARKLEEEMKEIQSRLLQRENKIQALTEAFRNLQVSETRLKNELCVSAEREKKTSDELLQYQSAWADVLAREAQARETLLEYQKAKRTIVEQKTQIQTLELEARQSQKKYHELQDELSTSVHRFRLEIGAVREQGIQREKLLRDTANAEFAKVHHAQEQLRGHITILTKELTAAEMDRKALKEAKSVSENTLGKSLTALQKETAMKQMEIAQAQMNLEAIKKESNKSFLIERLRNEAALKEMARKIDSLVSNGVYAEKIQAAPESMTIHRARSVNLSGMSPSAE